MTEDAGHEPPRVAPGPVPVVTYGGRAVRIPAVTTPAWTTRVARSVLQKNLAVKAGESVTIETWNHSLPVARALVVECQRRGARPLLLLNDEEAFWGSVTPRAAPGLGHWGTAERSALAATDVYVYLWGPADLPRYDALPERIHSRLTACDMEWYAVAKKSGLRGALLELGHATPACARRFGVSLPQWEAELVEAILVDPRVLEPLGEKVRRAFHRRGTVRIRHRNGTDLELGLLGANPRLHTGRAGNRGQRGHASYMVNVPGGACQIALDDRRAGGVLVANRPSVLTSDRWVGGRWRFQGGRLVEYAFRTGKEGFEQRLRAGGTGRDRPGLLCIGFNPRVHGTPLVEDFEMGTVSVSIGYNRSFGGRNDATSFLQLTLAGADVEVGGVPVIRGGRLV